MANSKEKSLFNSVTINPQGREELVGKRFLVVSQTSPKPKLSRIGDWHWKAGVIRCSSHVDIKDPELQVLVEIDDEDWERREWFNVYKDNYQLFAVEQTLVLAKRSSGTQLSRGDLHPAFTFKPLVDSVGLYKQGKGSKLPVEFLSDLKLDFQDCNKLTSITHWNPAIPGLNTSIINEDKVNEWSEIQRSQHLLTHGASFLSGLRLQVYRAEGTTQWYTAVTTGYNTSSQEYTLIDDTVLEEHYEDPKLTQMKLVGGKEVVDSILRGDNVTPRRSRSSVSGSNQQTQQQVLLTSRNSRSQTASPSKKSGKKTSNSSRRQISVEQENSNSGSESGSTSSSSKGQAQPQQPHITPGTRPRGRPAKKDTSKKFEEKESSDKEEEPVEEEEDVEDSEKKAVTSDKGRGRKNTSTVPKVKKVVKTPPAAATSPPPPPSSPPSASLASLRKKASKRSASVAALAAITTSQEAETAADEELFKPQQLEAKKKAVAIVRPQPQQPTQLQQPSQPKPSHCPKPQRNLDLQPQTNNRKTENLVEDSEKKNKDRNISSIVTQPHSSEIQEVDQTSNVGDREARFSLYDFPSDSESEEKPLSANTGKGSSTNKQQQQISVKSQQQQIVGPTGVISSNSTTKVDLNKKSSSTTYVKKFFPKKSKLQLEKQPPPNNNSKELQVPASVDTSTSSKNDHVSTLHQEEDEVVQPTTGNVPTERRSTPDSDILSCSISRPPTEAEISRSGSRSSTCLSVTSDEPNSVKKLAGNSNSMGDRQPPQQPSGGGQAADLRRPQASPLAGAPGAGQPPSSMAAGQAMSSQYALAAQQYQQAALAMAAAGSANPMAGQLAQAQLLAQYQQLAMNPEMLLKQYPHLPGAAGLAGPPHMLGRNPAADHHLLLQQAREREVAAERERQARERREAEQRERQEKERRERIERDRMERERREREREQQQKLSAVEAVDHHFQLSMELAKKRMAVNSAHPWGPMPGAKPPTGQSGGGPPPPRPPSGHAPLINLADPVVDPRRRFESEEAARRVQDHFMNSLRQGPPHSHTGTPTTQPSLQHHGHPHSALGGLPQVSSAAPPPAHGSGAPHRSSSSTSNSSSSPMSSMTSKHSLPPSHASLGPKPGQHIGLKGDPGPPPPLAPLQAAGGGHQNAYKPQNHSAVTFKPYDFGGARSRDIRDISPRGVSGHPPPGQHPSSIGGGHPPGATSYPTAYSAPPPARPKVTSPQVVNLYSKPIPARPVSEPAAVVVGPGGHGSSSTAPPHHPPPAHSTSSLPPGAGGHARSAASGGSGGGPPPPTKHNLPPPLAHGSLHPAASGGHPGGARPPHHQQQHMDEDMPLDLGAPSKRKLGSPDSCEIPTKSVKLEVGGENGGGPGPGQLHKVSEPSVLATSEVNITTVENTVLQQPLKQEGVQQPLQQPSGLNIKNEVKSENNQQLLPQQGSSTSSADHAPPAAPSSHYVHKLKKAWIKSYTEKDPVPPSGPFEQPPASADAKKLTASESYSAPSTPSNNNNSSRATPSPALSSVSAASKSGNNKKVNGHASSSTNSVKNDESELSSDSGSTSNRGPSSSNKRGGGKASNGRGGKKVSQTSVSGRGSGGGGGRGRLRGTPSNKTSDNDTLSDSDDNSKDSDTSHATSVHSRRSTGKEVVPSKGKRGRKPGRKSTNGRGSSTSVSGSATAKSSSLSEASKEFDFDIDLNEIERSSSTAGSASVNGRKGREFQKSRGVAASSGGHQNIRMPKENPFNNPPVNVLKKTGESFLQDADCFKVAPKLGKCRECKWSQHNKNAGSSASIFCRFYGFRRLRYHPKNGQLAVSGFCDPRNKKKDVTSDDAEMWEASADNAPEGLTVHQAKYCLELLKTDFDLIVKEERQAVQEHVGDDKVSWKRVVQGVSESCDVCDATLFNLHWACPRCGFVVCLHCYTGRKNDNKKTRENDSLVNGSEKTRENSDQSSNSNSGNGSNSITKDDKDKFAWLLCTNRSQHDLDKLMLTQIVTGEALEDLTEKLNACGVKFKIANSLKAGNSKVNGVAGDKTTTNGNKDVNKGASLRDLIGSEQKVKMSDIIDACVEDSMEEHPFPELKYFVRETDLEEDKTYKWRHGFAPKRRSYSLVETKNQYHNVPHSWLANGHVLKIEENNSSSGSSSESSSLAVDLFQEIWSRGQPVVVANTTKALISKWYPTGLNEEFGDELVELVNIKTNESLGEHPLKKFWDGYGCLSKRIKDGQGQPAVVRLSGWPGNFGEEFKDTLPSRSAEFLRTLPMSCYTGRAAPLNLAASLPEPFARAEVGPRATITYGDLNIATSIGLRDERADSVVVLIHAQIPKNDDIDAEGFRAKAIETMESLGCDTSALTKAREERLPAAVWTLFHPADGDKIRDFLNKSHQNISENNKRPLNYDPVTMDNTAQALNEVQLKKLKDEYDVKPYIVAQFPGEALFIPAGSLRQVKHLLSSISLESDFVCPENVSQSFFMYRQLRHLPESQKQPIVDKLSVKNLIFHSVKNALATLERNKINGTKDEDLTENEDDDDDKPETEDDN